MLYITDETKHWNRAEFYSSVKPPASDQSDNSVWNMTFLLIQDLELSTHVSRCIMEDKKLVEAVREFECLSFMKSCTHSFPG